MTETSELDTFFNKTKNDVDEKIKEMITNKKILLILSDGKRLRPILSYLSFKVCTQGKETKEQYQNIMEGGVSMELAHAASLVHDDIIDRDIVRRGKPAFHITEGTSSAVLIGHKMIAIGFDIALKHGKKVAKIYVDTWKKSLEGEMEEIGFDAKNIDETKNKKSTKSKIFDIYHKIIMQKTAILFSAACKTGVIEANASDDVKKLLSEYGKEIGIAYQMADDLVDLAKGEMIDSVVIPLLNKLEDHTIIYNMESSVIKKLLAKNLDKIKKIFINDIKEHVDKAKELSRSDVLPSSVYKEMLEDMPKYIITKMLKEINITI